MFVEENVSRRVAKETAALVLAEPVSAAACPRRRQRSIVQPNMAGATFTEVVDWLADHAGESVYVEVGMIDPAGQQLGDVIVVMMHTTLGEIENAADIDRQGKALVVGLVGGERDRIYIDPARVTRVEGGGGVLKVWIHDAFYIAFSGRVGPRGGVGYPRPSAS